MWQVRRRAQNIELWIKMLLLFWFGTYLGTLVEKNGKGPTTSTNVVEVLVNDAKATLA
jgi:hypothetical protein